MATATGTRRKTTKGKSGKRKASAAKVAAAKARDAALDDRAAAATADPAAFASRLMGALGSAPAISRFSIRNQALLMELSEEAGRPATQVATFGQWCEMGRVVREGESCYLRVVQPVGRAGKKADEDAKPATDGHADTKTDTKTGGKADGADAEDEGPRLYKFMAVFDISQTDGLDDADITEKGQALIDRDAAAAADPLPTLQVKLIDQAERIGYTVAYGDEPGFDADTGTLTVSDATPENLQTLTAAVTELVNDHRAQGKAAREAREAAKAERGAPARPQAPTARVSAEQGDVETFTVL